MYLANAIVGCALVSFINAQDATMLMQTKVSQSESSVFNFVSISDMSFEALGHMPEDAPAWCKNETELTWTQRKERLQGKATLEWAKIQYKKLLAENQTAPEWMKRIVVEDQNRGKMKWAAAEVKRLKEEGKEVPQWMMQLSLENEKWACRWAACKVTQLTAAGDQDVPQWLLDNAHKGIMEYATARAEEIEAEIQELEQEEQLETALVNAHGDVEVANNRMLARSRTRHKAVSVHQQTSVIEEALQNIDELELAADISVNELPALRKVEHAILKAREELVNMKSVLTNTYDHAIHQNQDAELRAFLK